MNKKVRVLCVDDSALMRSFLKTQLSADPDIELIGCAPSAHAARDLLVQHRPDVLTLDLEMPQLNGLSFLEWVMQHCPTRTLIVSGVSPAGSKAAIQALNLGAIDVLEKPAHDSLVGLEHWSSDLVCRVKHVALARLRRHPTTDITVTAAKPTPARALVSTNRSGDSAAISSVVRDKLGPQVIALAASTGGPEALREVMSALPAGLPPIVVVQHMSATFLHSFAQHLMRQCPYPVREAKDGERLVPGVALLAPGDFHLELVGPASAASVRLHQGPKRHGLRPAADCLFQSVAKVFGRHALGVVLTGMGRDGTEGLLEMQRAGAFTMGQSEATCVVFGMPKAAFEAGALSQLVDLEEIAGVISQRAPPMAFQAFSSGSNQGDR